MRFVRASITRTCRAVRDMTCPCYVFFWLSAAAMWRHSCTMQARDVAAVLALRAAVPLAAAALAAMAAPAAATGAIAAAAICMLSPIHGEVRLETHARRLTLPGVPYTSKARSPIGADLICHYCFSCPPQLCTSKGNTRAEAGLGRPWTGAALCAHTAPERCAGGRTAGCLRRLLAAAAGGSNAGRGRARAAAAR